MYWPGQLKLCQPGDLYFFRWAQLSRRQFVGVIASGALSTFHVLGKWLPGATPQTEPEARLVTINATYEEESGQVKVHVEAGRLMQLRFTIFMSFK